MKINKKSKLLNTLCRSALTSLFILSTGTSCQFDSSSNKNSLPVIYNNPAMRNTFTKNSYVTPWNDEIIYFVLTDRFLNGDTGNDFNTDKTNIKAYHGGDLQGVIDKLDYLKNLGTTTIWLSPVVDNRDKDFFGNWGYHGYWAKDLYKVDEHLGTIEKFKELVNKAHSKGIKILLDIVLNHVDYDHPIAIERHSPQNKYYSWFHHSGNVADWNNQWWLENGELGGLPDFDQSNPEVVKYLTDFSGWWIKNTGIDGFRVDTVKHVQKDFWRTFTNEMHNYAGRNFFLLGEVLNGNVDYCSEYSHTGFDSIFDFPLYYAINRALRSGQSMKEFSDVFSQDYLRLLIIMMFQDSYHPLMIILKNTGLCLPRLYR